MKVFTVTLINYGTNETKVITVKAGSKREVITKVKHYENDDFYIRTINGERVNSAYGTNKRSFKEYRRRWNKRARHININNIHPEDLDDYINPGFIKKFAKKDEWAG